LIMDQLRTALAWLKRYHFWVLSVLVALICIFCWYKGSANMDARYAKDQSTITGGFTTVTSLRNDPFHPNDDVNAKQLAQAKKQGEDVAKLWKQVYDRQRENALIWPSKQLSPEFIKYVENLQFGADIPSAMRNHYQNYVDGHFKDLPRIIDARVADLTAAGGRGPEAPGGLIGASNEQDESDYTCEWLPADQQFIRDELYFGQQPFPIQIWVAQENVWVYETLLRIIAQTNRAAGATRMSNAAVKIVSELSVGARAAKGSRTSGRLWMKPPAGAGPAPGEAVPGSQGPEGGTPGSRDIGPENQGPGGGAGGAANEEQARQRLLSNRYLNAEGKAIPFAGGGGGEAPANPDGSAAGAPPVDLTVFGQEYKRLPVRMVLQMDERWLPQLISECASQPLQVEVQEVRINPSDVAGLNGSPGGSGPGAGRSEGGGGGGFTFPEEPTLQAFQSHPEHVTVVIQGIIYIFNKPNRAILVPPDQANPTVAAGG
jgi:hypothetical protein